jgi:hypothetical protein
MKDPNVSILLPATKNHQEILSRTYKEGDTEVSEISYDNGETWTEYKRVTYSFPTKKPVSRDPKTGIAIPFGWDLIIPPDSNGNFLFMKKETTKGTLKKPIRWSQHLFGSDLTEMTQADIDFDTVMNEIFIAERHASTGVITALPSEDFPTKEADDQ